MISDHELPEPNSFRAKIRRLSWRRAALVFTSIGGGFVLVLAVLFWGISSLENLPVAAKTWRRVELPSVGVALTLKSDWNSGSVRYQFLAVPLSAKFADSFDQMTT